ncbi:SPRY domain-containing SOCS box protein 3 [Rhinichthys klamathensis goyatoka]|uniref:SPRY domain-containing SOCS box protein 3 n=1 Tax=Rhinichthys klamathensis goyatoka TaxID=3034132 RepID=UPI0024B5BB2A|nr:SPRY domain-containing SOCS box protein 3 [Rhinichthys klamathensis goyatoka]
MSWNKYVVSENVPEPEATALGPEDKQSEADSTGYKAVTVCVPAEMPPVVPVTGESFCQCPAQTELSSDAQISPYTLSCTCGEEEQGCDWVWDEEGRSSSVSLSRCNRTVSFHSEYSCGTAGIRGAKPLADGQHFWEIKMTSPVYGTDMMVGIGTSEVNLDQFKHSFCSLLGTDEDSWGLSYTGQLHHKGSKVNFSSRFGQGSIIGVHLDSWHGTLSFYKNRRCIGIAATHLQNKRLYPMVCSTAAKSSMKLIRSHSAATTLQYLCCTQLRKILPNCADALRVLPLPPGLRLLLSNQLGWVLTLGSADACADNSEDKATQTEDGNFDKYTSPFPSHNPSDAELVFISSSFSDNPGSYCSKDDPLDSASCLEASTYPDSTSCPDDAHYQNSVSIMDVTCYLDPSSLSGLYCGSAPTSDHNSLPNPIYQHISASCACCDPLLSVSSEGRKVNDLSSAYKPEHTGSCDLGPAYTPTGHASLWPDSASESDSDDFSSDLETYKRKRCRWT